MRRIILSKDPTTGRGPSNWGYKDIQELSLEPGFVDNLAMLLEDYVNGRFPCESEFARSMRRMVGVALSKKDPRECRGLGLREVLANLAASVERDRD